MRIEKQSFCSSFTSRWKHSKAPNSILREEQISNETENAFLEALSTLKMIFCFKVRTTFEEVFDDDDWWLMMICNKRFWVINSWKPMMEVFQVVKKWGAESLKNWRKNKHTC